MAADRAEELRRERSDAGAGFAQQLRTREGVLLVALWLLAGALAVRQTAAVLGVPNRDRFVDLFAWLGENGVLRVQGSLYDGDAPFTGTPFAGLVLRPLARAGEQTLGVAWTFATLLLVVALAAVIVRALPGPASRRTTLFAAPTALCLLVLSVPVRSTFHLGQTSIIPVLLALAGWLMAGAGGRRGGVLVGLAAALQPAVLLFAPLMWLTGRRTAALATGGTFAAATALAWAAMPADSWTYWVRHVVGSGLGGEGDDLSQSLHGALVHMGLRGAGEIALLAVLIAAVVWVALRRAVRYTQDGQLLLAASVTGCAAVLVAPNTWQHQLLWILLAVVGRVGKRTGDRLAWPLFVVLIMTLAGGAQLLSMPVIGPVADHGPLLAALLAACVVPFLSRESELWSKPLPSHPWERPNLVLELLLIRAGYWTYSYVRGLAPDSRARAEGNGDQILSIESVLRLDVEKPVNHLTADTGWLKEACNFYYTSFHFAVPLTILACLYLFRPVLYRAARAALGFVTVIALVGFWLYPLAPPRLMPGLGYVDTAHGPQDLSNPDFGALTSISNQYAAMPSLHVAWSLACAIFVFWMTKNWWYRSLSMLYPALTVWVVIATANHYTLDVVGGVLVTAAGFAVARLLLKGRDAGSDPGSGDGQDGGRDDGGSALPSEAARTEPDALRPAAFRPAK